jgi:hypothetical protein
VAVARRLRNLLLPKPGANHMESNPEERDRSKRFQIYRAVYQMVDFWQTPLYLLNLVSTRDLQIETHRNLQSNRDQEILELLNLLITIIPKS